jgi:hypothetical protein
LYHEGVLDQPVINKLTEILGYQGGAHSFLDILDDGKRTSPHKPAIIEEKLLTNSKNYLAIYYNHEGLRGDSLTQKVEEVSNKIQDVVKPYYDGAWNYWNSENNLLGDPDEGGVRESAKRNVLSEILHTGGHQLEQLSTKAELSSFLFGHPGYLSSWTDIDNIYRRISPASLLRIKFFATKWQVSDFENLQNPITISEYQLQCLKTDVIRKIDTWILSNPYKYDAHVSKGKYYVAETFRRYTRLYSQIDLIPDYELTNNLLMTAMQRKYLEFRRNNPHASITDIPPTLWGPDLSDLYSELGTERNLWESLGVGVSKPRWYSARALQDLLKTVTKWHRDEIGDRARGLDYVGRRPAKVVYDKNDPDVQDLLYYYQATLESIHTYADLKNFDLTSPTKAGITLKLALSSKEELVMNEYDVDYWGEETTKAYHVIYHLCRYLGFDPLTFTLLDDGIFKGGEKAGGYRRHHLLALMLRKMSSHVDDIVLTNVEIHNSYEKLLREKGLELDAEVYIKQLMKSLVELIEMKDQNGNFLKIDESHMKEVLYKNFGKVVGEQVLEGWKNAPDFIDRLTEFNDRRLDAFNGDYKKFLNNLYGNAYSAYFQKVTKITYTKILATQSDLDFLSTIYGIPFTLRPIQMKI